MSPPRRAPWSCYDLMTQTAEMPFAPRGHSQHCVTQHRSLSAQREHKGGKCVTKAAVSVFDICTNGTRGHVMENCSPSWTPKKKMHSGTRLHNTTQEAGASFNCV